jgi:hypothetical protein
VNQCELDLPPITPALTQLGAPVVATVPARDRDYSKWYRAEPG